MPTATRTFRVFVSSTFEDLKAERNALAAPGGVFSELTKVCQSFGARFQAIDLRWGVREEAGHDHRTMEICLGEIERCQRTGINPNFIVLLGDRYGWRPLPARIEAEEFRAVRELIANAEDRARVEDWYQLDENAVPPEYLLKPRTGEFKDFHRWAEVETPTHKALREAAGAAGVSRDALIKYEASATHQEILKGLGKKAEDREHVFAFFCKPSEPNQDPDLTRLKQFLREELKGNVFEPHDMAELCERVRENLERVIRAEAAAFQSRTALDIEVEAHDAFARDRARHFMGRKDMLGSIEEHVKGEGRRPLVVHGASGSGKSAVMARASEVLLSNPGNAVAIRRFIGVTPESSSGITLLRNLCEEIGQRCGVSEEIPVEFHSVVRTFAGRLALATADRPLVLFIDALDQIAASDPAADITWLMPELPPHCRVVLSTTDVARSLEGARQVELEALPAEDAKGALALWLHDARRELRDWQRKKVLDYYSLCGLPLYLKLAFEESRRWKSFHEPEACALGEGLAGIIDILLDRLSSGGSHGNFLVSRSLGYLATARYGLAEDEMLDVLTEDESVWQEFDAAKRHDPPERRLPVIVWSRLFLDLEPYLMERAAPGGTVATFYHRQLRERIDDRYLAGSQSKERHEALAGYFGKQSHWSGEAWRQPNARMAVELEYQQRNAGLVDAAASTLTDLSFVAAKCGAGLVFDLQEDYQQTIAVLPEAQAELAEERRATEELAREARALRDYARSWSEWRDHKGPAPPKLGSATVTGWAESSSRRRSKRERETTAEMSGRADRVAAFAAFVRRNCHWLVEYEDSPHFVVQCAFNSEPRGPIHEEAARYRDSLPAAVFLKRWSAAEDYNPHISCLRTLNGHTQEVFSVATTWDGTRVISGSWDGSVKLWDLTTGECLRTMIGHRSAVNAVAISTDGAVAVSGSRDWDVRLWDLQTGTCVRVLDGHLGEVKSVALTADGRRVVSCSDDRTIKVWEADGPCLVTLNAHQGEVRCVALTQDGRRAASCSSDQTLRMWNLQTGVCFRSFQVPGIAVLAMTPDGRRAITGGRDLVLWDLGTGESTVLASQDSSDALAISADGNYALAASGDLAIRSWDLSTMMCLRMFIGHTRSVMSIALNGNGNRAVSGSMDNTVKLWDLEGGSEGCSPSPQKLWLTAIAVTPDGSLAVSGSGGFVPKTGMTFWDRRTSLRLPTSLITAAWCESITQVEANARPLVQDNRLTAWDLRRSEIIRRLEGHSQPVTFVSASTDGRYAMSASEDATLKIWDLNSGTCIRTLWYFGDWTRWLAISPDGGLAVSGTTYETHSGGLSVWDVATGQKLRTLNGHKEPVLAVAIARDGQKALSGSHDRTLRLWDLSTGACESILQGHTDSVHAVAVSPDGTQAVSWAYDKKMRLWDIRKQCCLAIVPIPAFCQSVALTVDPFRVTAWTSGGEMLEFDIWRGLS